MYPVLYIYLWNLQSTLNICIQRIKIDYIAFSKYNSRYDPSPSKEDIAVTKRMKEVGELVGINLLDHIIIGDGLYISLKEREVI